MLSRIEHKRIAASEWQRNNPERAAKRKREWYLANREMCIQRAAERKRKLRSPGREVLTPEQRIAKRKQYMLDYYEVNKDIIIQRWVETKKKYMLDPMYRTKEAMRQRVNSAFRLKGFTKRSKTFEIVGCTFDELASYIEDQFVNGMSWENRSEWHIDHIVPLSVAKTEEELVKLGHYLNLRPLFAKDNFAKSDRMLDEFVPLRIKLLGR